MLLENAKIKGIEVVQERFTVANPEHVALARCVRELLARAGLMPPVTSGAATTVQ